METGTEPGASSRSRIDDDPDLWAPSHDLHPAALVLGVGSLRDVVEITVLSMTAWMIAPGPATVPRAVTSSLLIVRDRRSRRPAPLASQRSGVIG